MSAWMDRLAIDPTIGRLLALVVGIAVIVALVRTLSRSVGGRIVDPDRRYHARKAIAFAGYAAGALLLVAVYSHSLGNVTVAFGVAGAATR